ncbi:MAG: 50S ribosomal protein L31e [Candidatus Aenigmatarchaeota archaeon]
MPEERIFNIPLRDAYGKQRIRRSKKAANIVRNYLKRHMKAEKIKIGKSINENIWKRGAKKPPRKIRIHAIKEEDIVYAELIGVDIVTPSKKELKKKEKKKKARKEKIKKERKERRKMTIQEELEEESGKKKEPEPKEEIEKEIKEDKTEIKKETPEHPV